MSMCYGRYINHACDNRHQYCRHNVIIITRTTSAEAAFYDISSLSSANRNIAALHTGRSANAWASAGDTLGMLGVRGEGVGVSKSTTDCRGEPLSRWKLARSPEGVSATDT